MPRNNELIKYIAEDLLGHIPGITSRAMFGGYGVYKDGQIFAILAMKDELYFKTGKDEEYANELKELGGAQFTYERGKHKLTKMNYWTVSYDILEDKDRASYFVQKSLRVS